jgi:Leucine-rich repeat (LRR) protein
MSSFNVNGINYQTITSTTVSVIDNPYPNSYSGNIVIPNIVSYDNTTYTITKIEDQAFYNCPDLISVDFSQCASLTILGNYVFQNSGIKTVKFPTNITNIGNYTFQNCPNLISVDFSQCASLTILGDYVFQNSGIKTVKFPTNITNIGNYTFQSFPNLEVLILSFSQIKFLEPNTFSNLNKLVYLDLHYNLIMQIDHKIFKDLKIKNYWV